MNKKLGGLIVIVLVIVFIPNLIAMILFNNAHTWKYSADYEVCEEEFHLIKNYVLEKYEGKTDKWLSVSFAGVKRRTFYDPDTKSYVECPDEISKALDKVCDLGFPDKDADFDVIRICGKRVSFCIGNGEYALVYSPNEKTT